MNKDKLLDWSNTFSSGDGDTARLLLKTLDDTQPNFEQGMSQSSFEEIFPIYLELSEKDKNYFATEICIRLKNELDACSEANGKCNHPGANFTAEFFLTANILEMLRVTRAGIGLERLVGHGLDEMPAWSKFLGACANVTDPQIKLGQINTLEAKLINHISHYGKNDSAYFHKIKGPGQTEKILHRSQAVIACLMFKNLINLGAESWRLANIPIVDFLESNFEKLVIWNTFKAEIGMDAILKLNLQYDPKWTRLIKMFNEENFLEENIL